MLDTYETPWTHRGKHDIHVALLLSHPRISLRFRAGTAVALPERMNRTLLFLFVLALTASPTLAAETRERPNAVWVQPVGSVVLGFAREVYVSAGVDWAGGTRHTWTLEAAFYAFEDPSGFFFERQRSAWLTIGPNFFLGGGSTLTSGFFLRPKLINAVSWQAYSPDAPEFGVTRNIAWDLQVGLDVGYRLVAGALDFAVLVGASVGLNPIAVANGRSDFDAAAASIENGIVAPAYSYGFNLNIARVGVAF